MKWQTILIAVLSVCCSSAGHSQTMDSPDGRLRMQFGLSSSGEPVYSLGIDGKPILFDSRMGFTVNPRNKDWPTMTDPEDGGNDIRLTSGFEIVGIFRNSIDEYWEPVWGEESRIRNHCNEMTVNLKHLPTGILMTLRFRLFDDGLGFRYEFPLQEGLTYLIVRDEHTEFAMTGDHTAYWIPGDYDTQEFNYTISKLSEIPSLYTKSLGGKRVIGTPDRNTVQTAMQMKTDEDLYINIHEAALKDYSCMHLEVDSLKLISHLAPDAIGNKAYINTPFATPWRTVIVSDDARDILASRITLNLNEPCRIDDTSWIRPCKYVGVWWEMITGKSRWSYTAAKDPITLGSTDYSKAIPHGRHGATTENVMKYIDFAARHGFDAVLVEGWNQGWEDWENNWKENVFDFQTPYPDFDLDRITAYAKEKGVGMIMHHETSSSVRNYERYLDKAYSFMTEHGYTAVKSGYVGRIIPRGENHYGQYMVDHYQYAVEKAADYRLMVNAHEAVRPTGLCRTWPNLIGNESARGTEYQAFGGNEPFHTCILPFTRLIGGPMDFTPGIFEMDMAVHNPHNKTKANCTIANQLALYVVMSSPIQMACDMPEVYETHPDAFQFIKDVALDWDRSIYLEAEPAEYITIARKAKDSDSWFVGSISGRSDRSSAICLSFLDPDKEYIATVYSDTEDTDYKTSPKSYSVRQYTVTSTSKLRIYCAAAGGCAISIIPSAR